MAKKCCCCEATNSESCPEVNEHQQESCCDHDSDNAKREVFLLAAGALLYIIAVLIPFSVWIKAIVFAFAILISAYDILWDSLKGIVRLRLEENELMSIAVAAAFILGEYSEAALVAILFKLGLMLEDFAVEKSRKSTDALSKIRPEKANLRLEDGSVKTIDAKEVKTGATIIIRPGDSIPLDCEVISGTSGVDTSAITGESIPIYASQGTALLSGSVNIDGMLVCKVTHDYKNSAASKIVEMVYNSSLNKGQSEKFITRFARVYTPAVVICAVLLAIIPPLFGIYDFKTWIMRALIFLVASCPCALVISVPLSFFSTVGALSRAGILTKGSVFVEKLSKIKCAAFDKTGTLTTGRLEIESFNTTKKYDSEYALKLAASAEKFSSHPAAVAIMEFAGGIETFEAKDVSETAGLGVSAIIDGKRILCGSRGLVKKYYPETDDVEFPKADIYLWEENRLVAYFSLKEDIPEFNKGLMKKLSGVGIKRAVMLTGAGESAANKAAHIAGIKEYFCNLLPEGKVEAVKRLQKESGACLFVGDGINDAPVIAQADVGISIGLGSEIANASSDMILVSNRLSDIVSALRISKRGMRIMKFNVIFALAVKFIVLTLGVMGLAQMWMAVFADIGVTLITVLNSIRILSSK